MADDVDNTDDKGGRKLYKVGGEKFWADSRKEAIQTGLAAMYRQRGYWERELGRGEVTERIPNPLPAPVSDKLRQLVPPEASISSQDTPVQDISPQTMDWLGPRTGAIDAIFGESSFTNPPMFGREALSGEATGPMNKDEMLQAIQALGMGGASPLLSPEEMPASGYVPMRTLDKNTIDSMAALQQLTGANPALNPGMFLTDTDYISMSEQGAIRQMREDLGGGPGREATIAFNHGDVENFDFTQPEMMGYLSRMSSFDTSIRSQQEAIKSVNKDIETKIISDPLRDTNQYLFAKRPDQKRWRKVDIGFLETMMAEGPAIAGEIGTSTLMARYLPLKGLSGLKRQVGRAASQAVAATAGGVGGKVLQDEFLEEFSGIPTPTWEERKDVVAEIAALSGGAEILGRTALAVPRYALSGPRRLFTRASNTWKNAWEAHKELGGPVPLPAMFTANSMMKLNRIWNTTTLGQKDAVKRLQQGMVMWSNFRDTLGARSLKDVGGNIDGPLAALPEGSDQAATLLSRFNDNLANRISRGFGKGVEGWKGRVENTRKNYYSWMTTNMDTWSKRFDKLGGDLLAIGAKWDTRKIKQSMIGKMEKRSSIVVGEGDQARGIVGSKLTNPALKESFNDLMMLPNVISDREGYQTLRQLKTQLDNFSYENLNEFESEILNSMQHALSDTLLHPTTNISGIAMTRRMEILNKRYKDFRDTDRTIRASTIQGAFKHDPIQVGRKLIDPKNNPAMVMALAKVYKTTGDTKGFKSVITGYIGDVLMNTKNIDDAFDMLTGHRMDPESREAINILLGDPATSSGKSMRKDLRKYFTTRRDLIENPDALTFISDIENSGSVLLGIWDQGPKGRGQFNSIMAFLEDQYPGKGKEVASWAIFDGVLRNMRTMVDGKWGLDKERAGAILRQYKSSGLFDELLTDKQLKNFDNAMASMETIPGGPEMATSMAGQAVASKGLSGNMLLSIYGSYERVWLAIHARIMLDALAGAPFGYGKHGLEGSPKTRYLIANTLNAMDKAKAMGNEYTPGSRRDMSVNELLKEAAAKNQVILTDMDSQDEEYPSPADIYAQALAQDEENLARSGSRLERIPAAFGDAASEIADMLPFMGAEETPEILK